MKIQANGILIVVIFLLLATSQKVTADIYQEALANPARSAADSENDKKRKPDKVLKFFGIEPGMRVFDIFAGGGYYSEILSYVVGEKGSVTLYNNQAWNNYVKKSVATRLLDNRLPNVNNYVAAPESLVELKQQYDAAIFILGMHDIYYADAKGGWPPIDKQKFLKGIHQILKPGGILGVIDANAKDGANNEIVGKTLHRADPKVLIRDLQAVGFELVGQSNMLSNENDDLISSVFEERNKYNTDRSVLKFKKK
ncbi:class I SAM-dependent methyltransferase [Aliikangiella marina]|uniref:Class I SAM-dependent methyltransferase n=1 Tax=Aliikangiella marina TaxID=1712262 RepID=A0A545TE21_9GAMM|nr:class I SAM-dependent methyltransferase [Aliikangiella marina]TQV75473.1 class I SAM-dependent methyltransferase [Aliikangiella marina]